MTKRSSVIFTCVILIAVATVILLGAAVLRKQQLDASSQEFAVEVIPQILASGAGVLEAHAHPTLLQRQTNESRSKYLNTVKLNLGELQQLNSISGGSNVSLVMLNNDIPTAAYELDVVFTRGPAKISIELRNEDMHWQIDAFEVVSNQLAD